MPEEYLTGFQAPKEREENNQFVAERAAQFRIDNARSAKNALADLKNETQNYETELETLENNEAANERRQNIQDRLNELDREQMVLESMVQDEELGGAARTDDDEVEADLAPMVKIERHLSNEPVEPRTILREQIRRQAQATKDAELKRVAEINAKRRAEQLRKEKDAIVAKWTGPSAKPAAGPSVFDRVGSWFRSLFGSRQSEAMLMKPSTARTAADDYQRRAREQFDATRTPEQKAAAEEFQRKYEATKAELAAAKEKARKKREGKKEAA